MARRGSADIDLLRLVDLLQEHIVPALRHAASGLLCKTEWQREWTLDALARFWVAVILRAPKAFSLSSIKRDFWHTGVFPDFVRHNLLSSADS